jgi:mono/diheme cytochrome c family protein
MLKLWQGKFVVIIALAVLVLAFLLRPVATGKPVIINNTPVPPVPTLDSQNIARGAALYTQYCASCHGSNLEGAPEWKRTLADGSLPPPPHDSSGHTWHHPDGLLLSIIADGGDSASKSRMPAFKDQLSQEDMVAILDFIKSRWGREEREYNTQQARENGIQAVKRVGPTAPINDQT